MQRLAERPTHGATYGDAAIYFLQFAQNHPWRFLLTMLPVMAVGLLIVVVGSKLIAVGPITNHLRGYGDKRAQTRDASQPRLPP